jgi:hypothetical protein
MIEPCRGMLALTRESGYATLSAACTSVVNAQVLTKVDGAVDSLRRGEDGRRLCATSVRLARGGALSSKKTNERPHLCESRSMRRLRGEKYRLQLAVSDCVLEQPVLRTSAGEHCRARPIKVARSAGHTPPIRRVSDASLAQLAELRNQAA